MEIGKLKLEIGKSKNDAAPELYQNAIVPFVREGLCRKVGAKFKDKRMRMGTSFELAGGGRSFAHSRSGGTFACWEEGDPCVYMKYIMGIVVDSWYRPATVGSGSVFPSQTKNMCCDFQNETERGCRLNMIRKLDGLTTLLLATVFAAFLLYSCGAKQAPREIRVTVPSNYSGEMTLDPCEIGFSAEVTLTARGTASTSACPRPGETVTLTVVKGAENYRIPSNEVTIERAGDGLPVAIKAHVR